VLACTAVLAGHPANTHPETYPKYQVQLGRVAMLRDMVNWCIQNPVRGKPLADDDPKMKALEASIYAQQGRAAGLRQALTGCRRGHSERACFQSRGTPSAVGARPQFF
jgi:cytochrome c